jgi:hypothetical protein
VHICLEGEVSVHVIVVGIIVGGVYVGASQGIVVSSGFSSIQSKISNNVLS